MISSRSKYGMPDRLRLAIPPAAVILCLVGLPASAQQQAPAAQQRAPLNVDTSKCACHRDLPCICSLTTPDGEAIEFKITRGQLNTLRNKSYRNRAK
jgi:hypothetical protein